MESQTLITGAHGQLGRALTATFRPRGSVTALERSELDITDAAAVVAAVRRLHPTVILNCAAYNDVEAAQDDAETALATNAIAVRNLATAAAEVNAWFVHFSSDFVFDGLTQTPYTEEDLPNPRSTYAATKMLGEWLAQNGGRWFVLRVESLFGVQHWPDTRRVGSVDRIIDALEQRRPARVFSDRVVSPSYLIDVAEATGALLRGSAEAGIYHVVNTGYCTWHELALEVVRHVGGGDCIVPVEAASLNLKAPRPMFAALSNRKLAQAAHEMPAWQDAIARYIGYRRRIAGSAAQRF